MGLSKTLLASIIAGMRRPPLRIATTRGETPKSTVASSSGKTRFACRSRHKVGASALTSLAGGWSNFYIAATRVETSNAYAMTLQVHFEIPAAPTPVVTATFSGASSVSMASGAGLQLCDEINPSAFGLSTIAAGADIYIVSEVTVANVGDTFVRGVNAQASSGEGGWFGPTSSTAIGTGGALTTPGGGTATSTLYYPSCVLGRHVTPTPSAVLFGDSLVDGQSDNTGYGSASGGFFARGLYNINGGGTALAWARQAVGGTSALQASTNYTKQAMVWAYATHFVCGLGSNDGNGGQTAANTLTRFRTIYAAAHAAGVQRIEQMLCINRCPTSSDSWATAANMTPLARFETGGTFKDPLNTSVIAEVGSNHLNAYIDMAPQWADATLTDRVVGGLTGDGVHPNTTGHAALAAIIATRANTWTAT